MTSYGKSTQHIISTFEQFKALFPELQDAKLASGGLCDVKGENTSDVDIILISENQEISEISKEYEKVFTEYIEKTEIETYAITYTIKLPNNPREINVFVTPVDAYENSIIHRKNEMMLNIFTNLQTVAIWNKLQGMGTELAWATALGLDGDPYVVLCRSDLEEVAIKKEKEIIEIKDRI